MGISTKAAVFYPLLLLYVIINIVFELYKYDLVIISYFLIPILWVVIFSRSGDFPLTYPVGAKTTKFRLKNLKKVLSTALVIFGVWFLELTIYTAINTLPRGVNINQYWQGIFVTALFFTIISLLVILIIKAVSLTLQK